MNINMKSGPVFIRRTLLVFVLAAALVSAANRAAHAVNSGPDGESTVYVTKSGKSYHRENCSFLRNSKIAISLAVALRSGYAPCLTCKPPAPDQADQSWERESASLYKVNLAPGPGGRRGLNSTVSADISRMILAEVSGYVDGDTVKVRIAGGFQRPPKLGELETIRLIGVDTPETVHPRRPEESFGKEAGAFTKAALLGRQVYLAFDRELRDRYGRLLAYIYLEDGGCFNATLVREGYARAYTNFAFQFADEFLALEQEARNRKLGLWNL
ncbi:MAG: thermonuclease family protein [Treponema sp.]|jgi:micrococcal nuclease|nr:thermonuclease family protein [Treponema sp.]